LQAKQQALQIQQRANEELESRVVARTKALEEARHGLELANAELRRLSSTDPLTHLANRRQFDQMLEDEVRRGRRSGAPLTVLLGDIDHFKRINDTYGHPFGDECLRRVAAVLQRHCQRAGDLAARYGGEEFVAVLPECSAQQAGRIFDEIRERFAALSFNAGDSHEFGVTFSAGICETDGHGSGALLERADQALYAAKHNGRNQVQIAQR